MEGGKMESSKIVGLPTKIKRYLNNYKVIKSQKFINNPAFSLLI